jgi:hypothetical protein
MSEVDDPGLAQINGLGRERGNERQHDERDSVHELGLVGRLGRLRRFDQYYPTA